MDFSSDGFLGPNIDPRPMAINAISVANAIINAIATYSSILTPQNSMESDSLLSNVTEASFLTPEFSFAEE